jgi:hypothetical protein
MRIHVRSLEIAVVLDAAELVDAEARPVAN